MIDAFDRAESLRRQQAISDARAAVADEKPFREYMNHFKRKPSP